MRGVNRPYRRRANSLERWAHVTHDNAANSGVPTTQSTPVMLSPDAGMTPVIMTGAVTVTHGVVVTDATIVTAVANVGRQLALGDIVHNEY